MYLEFLKQALSAASYHENRAFSFAHPRVSKYSLVVAHLRSYFWELWSAWEYILQVANSATLKLDPKEVRRDFLLEVEKKRPEYKHLKELKRMEESKELVRIKAVRDHAHNWVIDPYQVEYNEDTVEVICINNSDSRDTGPPGQINIDRNDLWFMENEVKTLLKSGFFE